MNTSPETTLKEINKILGNSDLELSQSSLEKVANTIQPSLLNFYKKTKTAEKELEKYTKEYRESIKFLTDAISFYEKELKTQKELTISLKNQIDKINSIQDL